jgi:hypothetical protein
MRSKFIKIGGTLVLAVFVLIIGYNMGYKVGVDHEREHCIDAVAENCERICGIGRDAYFPDQVPQQRERELESEELAEDAVAMRESHGKRQWVFD